MDSVELWKYSSDKVIYRLSRMTLKEKYICRWESPNFYLPKTSVFITLCFFSYCRMVRTRTLTAWRENPRASCHRREKEKAILTVSHRTKGHGWTRLLTPMTSLCKSRLQCQWVTVALKYLVQVCCKEMARYAYIAHKLLRRAQTEFSCNIFVDC